MTNNHNLNSLPLVSIIIPMYNAEKYIAATIQSALAQTWGHIEIIIINNGSTDNSLTVAEGFKSDLIKVFSQTNQGASSARNYGLREAKGTYIQFLDADDLLMPNKIELQVKQLQGTADTLSACPVIHFNNNQTNFNSLKPSDYELSFYKDSDNPFEFLLRLYGSENNRGGMIPVHCWLTPAALITKAGNWNQTLTINDDGEFFCRVILQSKAIKVNLQTACYYRKHNGNLSLSSGKDLKSIESQYHSIQLRKAHLKNIKNDKRIDEIINRGLMELLVITYPAYKQLSKTIMSEIKRSGVPAYAPPFGGRILEFIKKTAGWKFARLLQYHYTNIAKIATAK